jgi:hypothetical protein
MISSTTPPWAVSTTTARAPLAVPAHGGGKPVKQMSIYRMYCQG